MSAVTRVALAVTLALAAGVGALIALAYGIVNNDLAANVDQQLLHEADAYAAAVGSKQADRQLAGLLESSRAYLSARGRRPSSYAPILLVKFADGRVVSNSEIAIEQASGSAAALDFSKPARAFGTVPFEGDVYRTATVPVFDARGKVIAVFQAALSVRPQNQIAMQVGYALVLTGLAIVLVGGSLSAFVARASLAPLHDVARTAEAIGQRSLSRRVEYAGPNDDVGRMVSAFNGMLGRLESAFGEQRRFVADASHELRTPLTIVRGHLDVLAASAGSELSGEQRETLELVSDELARMSRLVEDLLALARLETGQPRREHQLVEVCSLARDALDKARPLGERRFEHSGDSLLWVLGDEDQLLQALLNLLSNAVAHTQPDGHVRSTCGRTGSAIVVEIADDGPGIPPDDIPRVFDRFYRSRGPRPADTGGSGLGLAITRRLVELHGGTVSAANRPQGGAVFTVTLPAAPAPAHETETAASAPSAKKSRITRRSEHG